MLSVEVARDDAALHALQAEWEELWTRTPQATPFQHPAWLMAWWSAFGTGAPRVALLRGAHPSGELLGVLPLYDLVSERKILPIGAGLTDYQDALLAPEATPDAASTLLRAALRGAQMPCHLTDLPPHARLRTTEAPPGWHACLQDSDPCPVLDVGSVPTRQRRKLRMARHRARRAGGYSVRDAPAEDGFATLLALHSARWGERGAPGVLAEPPVQDFHRSALPGLARAGLLRLSILELAGQPAAAIYAMQANCRLFLYLSGFDAARSYESPGTLLLGEVLERAETEGAGEIHFLRGAEPYKYAWGATDRLNATRLFTPR